MLKCAQSYCFFLIYTTLRIFFYTIMQTMLVHHGRTEKQKSGVRGLVLLGIIRLNRLRLDDDCRVTTGEGTAFSSDGAGDVARGQS